MVANVGRRLGLTGTWVSAQAWVGAGVALLAVLIVGLPMAWLAIDAWRSAHALTVLSQSSQTWVLLLRSGAVSTAVTILALVIGVPLGLLVGRTDITGVRALWLVHTFPLFLPPFLLSLGWFEILGREGWLGSAAVSQIFFGEVGAIFVLSVALAPVVTSLTALGVSGVSQSLEESARTMATPLRVAARILVPAARPAVALAALIVFTLAFSELGVPMFLGVKLFPAAVFARLGGIAYAPGEAFALLLPLLPIVVAMLWVERRVVGARPWAGLGGLSLRGRPRLGLGRSRPVVSALAWLYAGLGLAPLVALAVRAWAAEGALQWLGRAPANGIVTAMAAATVITALGLVAGHGLARHQRVAQFVDALGLLAFITPATLFGLGLIAVWNRAATQAVYQTLAIIVVGLVAQYMVLGVRCMSAHVAQTSPHLEEAAAVCGASYVRRLVRIVAPIHARGLCMTWLLVVVFCLRDLETAILCYPPGGETLTVRMFTLEANGPPAVVATLAIVHVGITAVVVTLGALVFRAGRLRSA